MGFSSRVRLRAPLLALTLSLTLGALAPPALAVEVPSADGTSLAGVPEESSPDAVAALEQVQELVDPAQPSTERSTEADDPADLTMALRDLRLARDELDASDRATAARLLARPSTNQYRDFGSVRVHWTSGAVSSDWVNQVGAVVTHVLKVYKKAGFRAPKSDGTRGGGSGLLDIYLDDIGENGLYGYCDTDTAPSGSGPYDTWAYCAFDDDFAEFPSLTPLQNLKVTAAHELFHSVQFAYDYLEDVWFMEATAAWAEDEVYDGINDNRQYLKDSQLAYPGIPLDTGSGMSVYGGWIFFRYLTERFPKTSGRLPVLMRQLWNYADSVKGKDYYSVQAVTKVLADRGLQLRRVYAAFADANRRPGRSYDEGRHYSAAPLSSRRTLSRTSRDTGWRTVRLDHLTSSTVSFTPEAALRKGWRLRINLDLPNTARGSAAVVTTYRTSGKVVTRTATLNRSGNGVVRVGFGSKAVTRVELTLANASTRYTRCWYGGGYACQGTSLDDNRALKYRAQVVS